MTYAIKQPPALPSEPMSVTKVATLLGYDERTVWLAIELGLVKFSEKGKVFAKDVSFGVEYMREVKS